MVVVETGFSGVNLDVKSWLSLWDVDCTNMLVWVCWYRCVVCIPPGGI